MWGGSSGESQLSGACHLYSLQPSGGVTGFVTFNNVGGYSKIKITPSYVNGVLYFYGGYTVAVGARTMVGSDLISTLSTMVVGTTYTILLNGRTKLAIQENSGDNRDVVFTYSFE